MTNVRSCQPNQNPPFLRSVLLPISVEEPKPPFLLNGQC